MNADAGPPPASPEPDSRLKAARRFIVIMGVVSLFGDFCYEGARSIGGPYLRLLGASAAAVGFIAGLGEFIGYGLRYLAGYVGDRTHRYWLLTIFGYSLNLIVIPGMAFAGRWEVAMGLFLMERFGKAVRSPARSTLVSYAAKEVGSGWSFGLEEALDQIGAIAGPLLVGLAMYLRRGSAPAEQYHLAYLFLAAPALVTILLVVSARFKYPDPRSFETDRPYAGNHLGRAYWIYMAAIGLLGAGFADWAVIAFHINKTGMVSAGLIPVFYAGAMGVDGAAALYFGTRFDRHGLPVLMAAAGISALFAPLIFLIHSPFVAALGLFCWGVGMGATESILKAVIAELVPPDKRSQAYGTFYAVYGLCWWMGSAVMGALYDRSLVALVVFSVTMQLAAIPVLFVVNRQLKKPA